VGSTAHLSMELFKSMTGTSLTHVTYKGSAGVLTDVMGGQIGLTMDNLPPYLPQIKAGKIRALAVTTAKRSSSLPARNTKDLIEIARRNPGQLIYASTGTGGLTHMATELFAHMAKIRMVHVPFKSTGVAMPDLLSGQVQVMVAGMLGAQPFFESGKIRALAVTTAKRWPSLPQLPAIAETLPGYEAGTYYGILAPKGTPQAVIDKLNAEVNRILQDGSIKKTLEAQGMAPSGGSPAKFGERVKTEYDGWVRVVREAKLKVE
jgi:tripartite-type tricarboxylate transporter receptor subunit TctC